MRLADYLQQHGIKRSAFAAKLGVSPSTITGWCEGHFWPGRANTQKILKETNGAVTPNDFATADDGPTAARLTRDHDAGRES